MTKTRWDCEKNDYVLAADIDAFLADIIAVCHKHQMSLGHEDRHPMDWSLIPALLTPPI